MLKIYNTITKTALIIAIFTIPAIVSAGTSGSFGSDSWDSGSGWSDWGGNVPVYSYEYTPNYTYTTPSYTPSYTPNYYTPSYTTPSYGGGYYGGSSYSASSIPSSNYVNNTSNNTSTSGANATATATATNTSNNTNVNNNNVYVYTTPSGNAVVYNPNHQTLNGYCEIVPANPRVGQTVTATAYATGGIGNYSYLWGGDQNIHASGVSTSFTSYNPGTKYITVTIRSDQEVITKTCNVTFTNSYNTASSYTTYNNTPSSVAITRSLSSGVYLNDLPATGLSLNFISYMVAIMVLILAIVFTFVTQAKKRLLREEIA
jgi:hypothetical protein